MSKQPVDDELRKQPLCCAPFSQILFQPEGKAYPCCYHFSYQLGDIKTKNLEDIWNGKKLRRLRKEFLDGDIRICRARINNISCHKQFERFRSRVEFSEIQASTPQRFDLRLNGTCNLSCVMCDVWQQPHSIYDESFLWREGREKLFPFLKEIDVLGGEPFIQKDTFRLIDQVSSVNLNCLWGFVTNAHYPFTERLKTYLRKIKLRMFQVSIDSLNDDTYRAIRRGGDLSLTLKTVEELQNFFFSEGKGDVDFCLSMCVLQSNWQEIPQFIRFCKEMSARCDLQFAFYDPSRKMSLKYSSVKVKRLVVETLLNETDDQDLVILEPILDPLKIQIDKSLK